MITDWWFDTELYGDSKPIQVLWVEVEEYEDSRYATHWGHTVKAKRRATARDAAHVLRQIAQASVEPRIILPGKSELQTGEMSA